MLGLSYSSECPAKSILWNSLILINPQAVQWKRKWKRESCSLDSVQSLQFCSPIVSPGQEPGPGLAGPSTYGLEGLQSVSARLCSHIGARLGKYMLSNHPPPLRSQSPLNGWTSFYWAVSRTLASCWLWALGWRPSLSSWRWPSVPQGHLQLLYHKWLSQDGSKTLEQVIYNIM